MNKSNILLIIIDSFHFDNSNGSEVSSITPIDNLKNSDFFW